MARLLIVEDEVRHCESLRQYFSNAGHEVLVAGSAERAWEIVANQPCDAVLLDVRLPGMDGITSIKHLRELIGPVPIIVMTAFGTLDTASAAVRAGVFEYLVKPFSLQDLKSVLARALEHRDASIATHAGVIDEHEKEAVIGRSPVMQRIFNRVALVAESDVPVLLTGESGTGKEVLARAIHRYSRRKMERFLPVFLAALSPGLIESELFGHVRGAYTGAELHRAGLFEQAAGGTVLLDEIGDVPLPSQVKLLRALEQKEITRVGEDCARPIDIRFIAATNRSLPDLIRDGSFRADLFYRLSVYHIELPPLRERPDDIPDLAHYFLGRVATVTRCPGFSTQAMSALESRPWYGNIRELRNAVEHAAIASRGALINESHLPPTRNATGASTNRFPESIQPALMDWLEGKLQNIDLTKDNATVHQDFLHEVEPTLISMVLNRCRGNQSAACRILGMDPKTLKAKSMSHRE